MVELLIEVHQQILDNRHIHTHHVVQDLDAEDSQREDRLREDHKVVCRRRRGGFEGLIARQEKGRDHLYDGDHVMRKKHLPRDKLPTFHYPFDLSLQ